MMEKLTITFIEGNGHLLFLVIYIVVISASEMHKNSKKLAAKRYLLRWILEPSSMLHPIYGIALEQQFQR